MVRGLLCILVLGACDVEWRDDKLPTPVTPYSAMFYSKACTVTTLVSAPLFPGIYERHQFQLEMDENGFPKQGQARLRQQELGGLTREWSGQIEFTAHGDELVGQKLEWENGGHEVSQYSYNPTGQLAAMVTVTGECCDENGKPLKSTESLRLDYVDRFTATTTSNSGVVSDVLIQYGVNGRLNAWRETTRRTHPGGFIRHRNFVFDYDPAGRITEITDGLDESSSTFKATFGYCE